MLSFKVKTEKKAYQIGLQIVFVKKMVWNKLLPWPGKSVQNPPQKDDHCSSRRQHML